VTSALVEILLYAEELGAGDRVVVKALRYKAVGRVFETRCGE
jgi:hypothetical protein